MTRSLVMVVSLFVLLLTGCGSMPKTPDLLVENAKNSKMFSQKDEFVAKRSLDQITAVFKKKSSECLQVQVTRKWRENGFARSELVSFTPAVLVEKQRTRLTLQSEATSSRVTIELGGPPPNGWYFLVADAYSVDKNTTRVESYYQSPADNVIFKALRNWADGSNMGCPDLTK